MHDPMLSSLKSYWERLRAGRLAPFRAEIDPRQFETALENMFIVERLAADNMRIRLAGMRVCEMMAMEVRGMQAGYLVDEADRLRFERLLNVVMTEPAVVELALSADGRAARFRATMLLMPLRSDFGDVNRVLGCVSGPADAVFAAPLAFRIETVGVAPVEPSAAPETREPLPGFAEDRAGFEPAPIAPRLRAIEGNPDAPHAPRPDPRRFRVIDGK